MLIFFVKSTLASVVMVFALEFPLCKVCLFGKSIASSSTSVSALSFVDTFVE